MRIAAGIEYCGTDFCGWQRQSGQRTIQGCVEEALSTVADHPVEIQCAGRTDAGVHAIQQIVHFDTLANRNMRSWVLGANTLLPPDVNLLWAKPVSDDFSSRFSATSRHYKYLILNRPVRSALGRRLLSYERRQLDTSRMTAAAVYLKGEHDFTSYRAVSCQSKTPVREVSRLSIERREDLVIIDIEANAFLHHMVRNIAGVLMCIGTGEQPPEWSKQVLEARDRTLGGMTAPPDGLYLINAHYPAHLDIPVAPADLPILRQFGILYRSF
jgi:tRNA pseudouridine38-40 synthase